jgi:hypothetical protein
VLAGAGIQLSEQSIGFQSGWMASAMDSTHIVGNIFAKTKGLDRVTGEVASTNEAATKIKKNLRRPSALGVARTPECSKEPL